MASTTINDAGQAALPVELGDDGFVRNESAPPVLASFGASLKMNASELRAVIANKLETTARNVDWNRDNFAETAVSDCIQQWGEFNWIMCHTAHSYVWMGERGVDWEHWHYELDIYGPGTIGYEVYWARQGVFSRNGDGGFINWAYIGNVQKVDPEGKTLLFSPR